MKQTDIGYYSDNEENKKPSTISYLIDVIPNKRTTILTVSMLIYATTSILSNNSINEDSKKKHTPSVLEKKLNCTFQDSKLQSCFDTKTGIEYKF